MNKTQAKILLTLTTATDFPAHIDIMGLATALGLNYNYVSLNLKWLDYTGYIKLQSARRKKWLIGIDPKAKEKAELILKSKQPIEGMKGELDAETKG